MWISPKAEKLLFVRAHTKQARGILVVMKEEEEEDKEEEEEDKEEERSRDVDIPPPPPKSLFLLLVVVVARTSVVVLKSAKKALLLLLRTKLLLMFFLQQFFLSFSCLVGFFLLGQLEEITLFNLECLELLLGGFLLFFFALVSFSFSLSEEKKRDCRRAPHNYLSLSLCLFRRERC